MMNLELTHKQECDAHRAAVGLPPIFVAARPLTMFEREGRPDIILHNANGTARRHFVPMLEDGLLIYRDVLG